MTKRATPALAARAVPDDPRGVSRRAQGGGGPAAAGLAFRRALCRQLGHADVVLSRIDAAARDRGTDRRRRRRVVRRLSALRGGLAGRRARSLAGAAPLAGGRFAIWQWLPAGSRQKSLAAAVEAVRRRLRPSPGAALSGVDLDLRRGPPGVAVSARSILAALPGCRPAGVSCRAPCAVARPRCRDRGQPGRSGRPICPAT